MKFIIFLLSTLAAHSQNVWASELDDLINQFDTLDLEESIMFNNIEKNTFGISEIEHDDDDNTFVQTQAPKQRNCSF